MSRITFVEKRFRPDSLTMIRQANAIISEYEEQDLRLTLRQLYYQFVSRDLIPNTDRSYKNLGSVVSDARLAGLIDWEAIEDRVRVPRRANEYDNLADLAEAALRSYRLPRWKGQDCYAELWVEKDALAGVLEPLSREYHVTLMVNRGYSSQSAMFESAQRFLAACEETPYDRAEEREPVGVAFRDGNAATGGEEVNLTRRPVLFYLGDHDPSGEDMVRDIRARFRTFGIDVDVTKVALTMDQVRRYNPPPNPAKVTDSRAAGYIAKYGDKSWEVDALPPNVLAQIIRSSFRSVLDVAKMNAVKAQEETDKVKLREAVSEIMNGKDD